MLWRPAKSLGTTSLVAGTSGTLQRTCLVAPVGASQVAGVRGHQAGGIDAPRGHDSTIPDAGKTVPTVAPHHLQRLLSVPSLEVCCADTSDAKYRDRMQHTSCLEGGSSAVHVNLTPRWCSQVQSSAVAPEHLQPPRLQSRRHPSAGHATPSQGAPAKQKRSHFAKQKQSHFVLQATLKKAAVPFSARMASAQALPG